MFSSSLLFVILTCIIYTNLKRWFINTGRLRRQKIRHDESLKYRLTYIAIMHEKEIFDRIDTSYKRKLHQRLKSLHLGHHFHLSLVIVRIRCLTCLFRSEKEVTHFLSCHLSSLNLLLFVSLLFGLLECC